MNTFILIITSIVLGSNLTATSIQVPFATVEQCEAAKSEILSTNFIPVEGSEKKLKNVYSANRAVCIEQNFPN